MLLVLDAFATEGISLPERRGLAPGSPGEIAWDCEQVVVALATLTPSAGGGVANLLPQAGSPAGVGLVRLATWSIQIVRCTPEQDDDGNPPDATTLAVAGQAQLDDIGALSQCLTDLAGATPGSVAWLPAGTVINAGGVTTLGPAGGFHGVEATVSISAMEVS
jgi:hypothetical protein